MMTVAWLVGWMVGWLAGWLVGRSVGWLVGVGGWVGRWMDGMIEVLKSSWALSLSSGHMNPTFHSRVSRDFSSRRLYDSWPILGRVPEKYVLPP